MRDYNNLIPAFAAVQVSKSDGLALGGGVLDAAGGARGNTGGGAGARPAVVNVPDLLTNKAFGAGGGDFVRRGLVIHRGVGEGGLSGSYAAQLPLGIHLCGRGKMASFGSASFLSRPLHY